MRDDHIPIGSLRLGEIRGLRKGNVGACTKQEDRQLK